VYRSEDTNSRRGKPRRSRRVGQTTDDAGGARRLRFRAGPVLIPVGAALLLMIGFHLVNLWQTSQTPRALAALIQECRNTKTVQDIRKLTPLVNGIIAAEMASPGIQPASLMDLEFVKSITENPQEGRQADDIRFILARIQEERARRTGEAAGGDFEYISEAATYARDGDYGKALSTLRGKSGETAALLRGWCLKEQGNFTEARKEFASLSDNLGNFFTARTYEGEKDFAKAAETYETLGENITNAYFYAGYAWKYGAKNEARAQKAFAKVTDPHLKKYARSIAKRELPSDPTVRYRIEVKKKWGFIDNTGKVVIALRFNFIRKFSGGLAYARTASKKGYINTRGDYVIFTDYTGYTEFSEGLAGVRQKGKFGFINRSNKFVITPRFDEVKPFSQGFAAVRVGAKWGYIDTSGNFLVKPSFHKAYSFSESLALVHPKPKAAYSYINMKGEIAIASSGAVSHSFSEGVARVHRGRWGYIDKTGSLLIKPKYAGARNFSEGLAAVRQGRPFMWGYIDKTDTFKIKPRFQDAREFSDGLAAVKLDGVWGYVDKEGALAVTPQYDKAWPFSGGLARVKRNKEMLYINKTGAIIWPPKRPPAP